jgi:hypothetical protein
MAGKIAIFFGSPSGGPRGTLRWIDVELTVAEIECLKQILASAASRNLPNSDWEKMET